MKGRQMRGTEPFFRGDLAADRSATRPIHRMFSRSMRVALLLSLVAGLTVACASQKGYSAVERQPDDHPVVDDPVLNLLRNKSAGLEVYRTQSGEIAVTLRRGPTSFYGGNMPLYLVDDTPFSPGPNGELIGVNPYDIESIKGLTRPEDTTIYGVRGANGVIVIHLKKPGRSS